MTAKDRTWAEISLENIKYNYASIKSRLSSGVELLGVVKADAYGHGAVPVAHAIVSAGCKYLAVATDCEALELRRAGISSEIIILGYTSPGSTESLIENNIIQSVSDYETARPAAADKTEAVEKASARGKQPPRQKKLKFTYKEEREFETINDVIAGLEAELARCDREMEEAAADYVRLNALTEERKRISTELDGKMERWLYLTELAERIAQEQN